MTRYGRLRVPDTGTDLIGRFLARYGEWAQFEIRFIAGNLSDGARVADIGAFVGTFGLGLAQLVRLSDLCFVEANPDVAPLLRENVARNAAVPATVIEAAVAPANGVRSATIVSDNIGSWSLAAGRSDDTPRGRASDPARALSLAQLRAENGPFDLIKLDVEGMEREILREDAAFLETGTTIFWLECNETIESLNLVQMLLERNLDITYFAFPAFAPDNFLGAPDAIFPFAYESGLWAARGKQPLLDASLAQEGCILVPIGSREDLRAALWRTPRWGPAEWQQATPQAIVASVAHDLLGDTYDRFLVDQPHIGQRTGRATPKYADLQQELSRSQEMARSLELLLRHDRARMSLLEEEVVGMKMAITSAQTRLRSASDQARGREDDLTNLSDARNEEITHAAARAERAEIKARRVQSELDAIHRSTTWKLMVRVTAVLSTWPSLRRLLRAGVFAMHRGIRFIRPARHVTQTENGTNADSHPAS